jgi:hypothetical protein
MRRLEKRREAETRLLCATSQQIGLRQQIRRRIKQKDDSYLLDTLDHLLEEAPAFLLAPLHECHHARPH